MAIDPDTAEGPARPSVSVDGIWPGHGTSLLSTLTSSLFQDGQQVWVRSVGRYFRLASNSALATTGTGDTAVVNALGLASAQWLGIEDSVNLGFLSKGFWAYDPQNSSGLADDENQGWGTSVANAELSPLRTSAELNRRMFGRRGSSKVIFSLMSDDDIAYRLTNIRSANGQDYPIITGKRTQIGSDYVASAYSAANPAGNAGYLLSATGLGGAGNVGKLISNAAANKWAVIQASVGADQVRLTQPNSFDIESFSGSFTVSFSVGETVRVWDLPRLSQWPFTDQVTYPGVDSCEILGFFSNGNGADVGLMGSSSPVVVHSIVNGVVHQGSVQGFYIGSQFAATSSNLSSVTSTLIWACGIRGATLLITGGVMLFSQNLAIESGVLSLSDNNQSHGNDPTASFGVFNCPTDAVIANAKASLSMYPSGSLVYGAGNAGFVYLASAGSSSSLPSSATAATSAPAPISLAGTSYDYADLPIADLVTGSFINSA